MWYSWFIMIKPISVLPHLLNWISCWIEFFLKIFELNIFLNWICLKIFELNNFLNWIFVKNIELDNFLNWIFVKYYWIEYWIESFFGKIQILNWINLGIAHPYPEQNRKLPHFCLNKVLHHLNWWNNCWIWWFSDWFADLNFDRL